MDRQTVNGLLLPPLLLAAMRKEEWCHPGDDRLRRLIPFFQEPVDFLRSVDAMQRESSHRIAGDPALAGVFRVKRGSCSATPVIIPWLDVERAVFIAVNRVPGDDIAIALDYRTSFEDPRVVANVWHAGPTSVNGERLLPRFRVF